MSRTCCERGSQAATLTAPRIPPFVQGDYALHCTNLLFRRKAERYWFLKVETHGFDGQSCKDASKFIETALGQKTTEQFKPEFFTDINHHEQTEVNQ